MSSTTATAGSALRRLRAAALDALADLRWVRLARAAQLERLAGWRGRHATVHRDSAAVLLAATRRVEHAVGLLAMRVEAAIAVAARAPLLREDPAPFTSSASATSRLADAGAAGTGRRTGRQVAADPAALRAVVEDARPHGEVLRSGAAALVERAPHGDVGVETRATAAAMQRVAQRWDELDSWVAAVADALAREDRSGAVALVLLGLGTDPSAVAVADDPRALLGAGRDVAGRDGGGRDGAGWHGAGWHRTDDAQLLRALRDPALPTAARHHVTVVLLERWADRLDRSAAAVGARAGGDGAGVLDRLATALDEALLDPIDPAVHVRTDAAEEAAELGRLARGLRALTALDDATLLDVRPGVVGAPTVGPGAAGAGEGENGVGDGVGPTIGPRWRRGELAAPSVRLSIGDPAVATHVAVLLAGTGSGVGRHAAALRDARALHAALAAAAPLGSRPAVVLELYDAPVDIARAADPRYATVAARELATGLVALGLAPGTRTTLVGHSYGAVAAGLTAAVLATAGERAAAGTSAAAGAADRDVARVDALVALGAPGLGVASIAELGVAPAEVWAARTWNDPIVLVGDVGEVARAAGASGPLRSPTVAHGPDPAAAGFGARRLPTSGPRGRAANGHLEYLDEGTASLAAAAAVVLGRL